ncbi:MAG TPA: hypothetical protein VNR11_13485 [Xanthobacteraceae bacterium]|nr:hypothetical protein [Xanthobacteraceae bacterium]
MKLKALVVTVAVASAAPAGAGWFDAIQGNDTGGIIPWGHPKPEYALIAAAHCATYNKIAFVTSFPRKYGDYAGFICAFPRDYDPVKAQAAGWWWWR